MEDRELPITVGQGAGARVMDVPLPPFTLVGATTRAGLLTTPLRDRFGIQHRLEPYAGPELAAIVHRSRAHPRLRDRRGRRRRARPPLARHAARGQPAAQARARLRRGPRLRRRRRRRRPTPRSTCWRSTTSASTASTARSSTRSARSSTAAPSASRRWRSPSARSRTRSRTSTSPTCCSAASSSARHAAASPRSRAYAHLGLEPRGRAASSVLAAGPDRGRSGGLPPGRAGPVSRRGAGRGRGCGRRPCG